MTKLVLVGAGSLQFGTGMLGDIFQSAPLKGAEIVLNDINEGETNDGKDAVSTSSGGQAVLKEDEIAMMIALA